MCSSTSSLEPDVLCSVSAIPLQHIKLFCLHVFRQSGTQQRVDCLDPRWELALSVFPKDTEGFATFRLLVRRSTNWATPPPYVFIIFYKTHVNFSESLYLFLVIYIISNEAKKEAGKRWNYSKNPTCFISSL